MRGKIGAGVLEEGAVLHTRRADRLAGAAPEATVDVHARLGLRLDAALEERLHEMDAATRRLRLEAGDAVGRTGLEAHPAADALLKAIGHVEWGRGGHLDGGRHQ